MKRIRIRNTERNKHLKFVSCLFQVSSILNDIQDLNVGGGDTSARAAASPSPAWPAAPMRPTSAWNEIITLKLFINVTEEKNLLYLGAP